MTTRLSVITRTYRRPLLLARAARSVAGARIEDMEWIVVDDDETITVETERVVQSVKQDTGIAARAICSKRGGRGAAANMGLKAAAGVFVHIHDDDDMVEPEFYRATLAFLRDHPRYKAVRCMCMRVYEEISGETIRTVKRKRVYPERRMVSLLDAAEVFAYPPIGSVFDRQVLVDIGGFDEKFNVGEDYELLLRFLVKADMGTIAECLATVHVRGQAANSYANSPMERSFAEEHMLFVNALLRRDLETGRFGPGFLLALGRLSRRQRTLLDFLDAARKRLGL